MQGDRLPQSAGFQLKTVKKKEHTAHNNKQVYLK